MKPWNLLLLAAVAALPVTSASAAERAHQHGVVSVTATLDGGTLRLDLNAPLDAIVGFERAPRTAAEKASAAAALKQLDPGAALWLPNAEAGCRLASSEVEAPVLQGAQGAADGHADLEAGYEFRCEQPQQLTGIQHQLFKNFPRIKRIDFQYALPSGQGRAQLRSPQALLPLKR